MRRQASVLVQRLWGLGGRCLSEERKRRISCQSLVAFDGASLTKDLNCESDIVKETGSRPKDAMG